MKLTNTRHTIDETMLMWGCEADRMHIIFGEHEIDIDFDKKGSYEILKVLKKTMFYVGIDREKRVIFAHHTDDSIQE